MDFRSDEIRVVLMGRTGAGKSSIGNTCLGETRFTSRRSPASVTQVCEFGKIILPDGRKFVIIDTPGFFDTKTSSDKLAQEISRCVSMSSPGPHAFIFVIKPERFTEEEVNTVEMFFKMFGRKVEDYMIVVFTCADQLEGSIDDFIAESPRLRDLMRKCNNRKYCIDNKTTYKRDKQVRELVNLIDVTVSKNGGSFYSNDMYEENVKLLAEQERQIKLEHERREQEKVKAIEREVTEKYEIEMSQLRENELKLNESIKASQKQLEIVEKSLGSRSKEADDYRKQINELTQQRGSNNDKLEHQLLTMQREMEQRHHSALMEMNKQMQQSMDEFRRQMTNIHTPEPRGFPICLMQ